MDLLDAFIIAIACVAAIRGSRTGAACQVLSFCGFLLGLAIGDGLVVLIDGHVAGQLPKSIVALVVLVIPATILWGAGRRVGQRVARLLHEARLGVFDAIGGASVSIVGSLLVCWLFASILINSAVPTISRQIEDSRIVEGVGRVMPPVPDAFSSVERYLAASGFPQVLVNILPETLGPVRLPGNAVLQRAIDLAGPSTVRVIAFGCEGEQEGSGFIATVTPTYDLIVTNAHVIAGTHLITVETSANKSSDATPVLFDPRFDLAVLKTSPLGTKRLNLDALVVERGTQAVVLGYPGGGPFEADKAGVLARFAAEGRDIYDNALTVRTVYELGSKVRPGNSGGPLIANNGQVIGVVFSRSASNEDVGFALASPGVLQRVEEAQGQIDHVASTMDCVT